MPPAQKAFQILSIWFLISPVIMRVLLQAYRANISATLSTSVCAPGASVATFLTSR